MPMSKTTDVAIQEAAVWFLANGLRMPLRFGVETLTHLESVRVRVRIKDERGRTAEGWGETPLSASWVWPSMHAYAERVGRLKYFCLRLAGVLPGFERHGHPIEISHAFMSDVLPSQLARENIRTPTGREPIPWLAAVLCYAAFDLALHDAYGNLHGVPVYETYNDSYMNADLAAYLTPAAEAGVSFVGRYPQHYLTRPPATSLVAWHLVGGTDPLSPADLSGNEPDDGYPLLLTDWIRRDGLKCLKIKLCGTDSRKDYRRLVRIGRIARDEGVEWLSPDFNCTVTDPAYVNDILDRLQAEYPDYHRKLLYVEQPFPYSLEAYPIDVHSVSNRKPLFMDESAHDWEMVRFGRSLGWTGVALKTCKTQTGALLSLCWAKAHGMAVMVQDLTNSMLAQVPHVLLAAHAGTIMGVESNGMQFCPGASLPEAAVHPGLYQRREGRLDLSSLRGPGFGYRLAEIKRQLPPPATT